MSTVRLNIGGNLTPKDGVTPVSLNKSYDAPSVLTCRLDRPSEFIPARFGGRSIAELYIDDVLWFRGRYGGLSETREPDNHSTEIAFVGPKADLNFTVWANNGSPVINFGNDSALGIIVKLSNLLSVQQGLLNAGVTIPSIASLLQLNLQTYSVPGTYEITNRTFREAIDQIFEYAPRFKWTVDLIGSTQLIQFHHIDNLSTNITVSLNGDEIVAYSLQEDATDRYSAVRLIGDIIQFDGIPVHSNLIPAWNTSFESEWTIHDFYNLSNVNPNWSAGEIQQAVLKGQVYRRYSLSSTGLALFNQGAPVKAFQLYETDKNDANKDIWNPVEIQDVDWPFGIVTLKWPAILPTVTEEQARTDQLEFDANIPGKAAPAKAVRLLGTGFISTQPGKRYPVTGYAGQSFNKYGNTVERVIYQAQTNTLNDVYLSLLHAALSNLLISGSVTLNTLRQDFLNLGTYLNITDKRGTFGLENLNMLVTSVNYNIESQVTTLAVSTDRRPFTLGA